MRILLIEPDQSVAQSIELMLRSEAFNVYTTDLGEEGTDLAKMYDYDLVLLELRLPDISGWDVIRSLRVAKCKTPILVISGLSAIEDKVKALGVGADDYMTKPFHKDELVARIHAIVRRTRGHAQSVVECGPLCLNLNQRTCTLAGQPFHLTGKEYAMVELLALRKGSLITKEMFLNHLYGGMDEPEIKIIDVFICKIRKRLGEHFQLIQTVWGRGYVLGEPMPIGADSAPEVREMLETASQRGPGYVTRKTFNEHRAETAGTPEAANRVKSPPLVPLAGQK